MNFSYDRAWADVVAMARANVGLLATLAGVFLFLPSFAMWLFAPLVPPAGDDGSQALNFFVDYYRGHWPAFVALTVASSFGQIAMLALLLDRSRPTVGEALGTAGRMLLPYLGLTILTNLALVFGFFAFLVPGLYLMGRLAIVGPVMVAERMTNPVAAIQRSWDRTAGRGWRVSGFLLLIAIVGWIALSAATSVIGVVAGLVLPEGGKALVAAAADAVGGAGLALLLVLLSAAIYRQIAGQESALQDVFN